jgi:hypothetical protein
VLVVAYAVARSAVVNQLEGPEEQAAARAVWDVFLGDRSAAWILAGSGAVVAAAASSLIKPLPLGEPLRVAGAWLAREPRSRIGKALYSFKKAAQLTNPENLDKSCEQNRGPEARRSYS